MVIASTITDFNLWVIRPQPNPEARLRLFCFAHAGGNALIYRTWSDYLPADVELCLVQLPGRGGRLLEEPFTDLSPLVQTLAQLLAPHLQTPFAFFGHSMGALISFELARQLRREDERHPQHLWLSAFRAPQLPDPDEPTYHLPDADFLKVIRRLNGTPPEILQNDELMQLMLPMVRADITICETYTYVDERPLASPITVFGGRQDSSVRPGELAAWRRQTSRDFALHMFDGDHFFINTARLDLLRVISETLQQLRS